MENKNKLTLKETILVYVWMVIPWCIGIAAYGYSACITFEHAGEWLGNKVASIRETCTRQKRRWKERLRAFDVEHDLLDKDE